MQPIIKVHQLTKRFNQLTAVDQLSFTVYHGDVYGFLGQNGAGKSTTIRMLLSLIKPTSGNVEMFGYHLHAHRNQVLKNIGAVIEKPDLYKYLTALENLRLFSQLSGGAKLATHQLMDQLEVVGLQDRAHSKINTYSQGMKQRLGIAIALVHDPQLVILDEPTNGLDPQGIADIRDLIRHLSRDRKKTILISSHLLSEIEMIATRLLIIDKGKKLVEGATADLFSPEHSIVELETTDNNHALQLLQQSEWSALLQPVRSKFIVLKMEKQQVAYFNKWLVQQGIMVSSLQPKHSLEDYFLQVTSGGQHVETF